MNDGNLIIPTSEQARTNGRLGGIASQKKQREKKALQEMFNEFLLMKPTDKELQQLQEMGYDPSSATNMTAWVVSLFKNGAKGNSKALEIGYSLLDNREKELKIKRQEAEIEKLKLECEKLRLETNTGVDIMEDLTPLAEKLGFKEEE